MVDRSAPDEIQAWVGLRRVDALLADVLDGALRTDVGLTLVEHDLLRQIAKGGGMLQMGDVARTLVLSKSGITRLVGKLEADGLLERLVFPQDRRATFARLTPAGYAALTTSDETFARVLGSEFGTHLSATDLRHLTRILGKLLDAQGWCGAATCVEWARADAAAER